ncbi:hypothetical protein GD1_170 [Paraglaciecola Antarctic GD virus 1]|nr:hypothetical protein GD1_170 [Paraglaciecola Antarctic GD virus 1]
MKKYLRVFVYANDLGDSTNGGVSFTHKDKIVVPCERGNITEADVEDMDLAVLELKPSVIAGYSPHFIPDGETRWTMFGGNFVYTSDSRFKKEYGDSPVKIFDRIEGK